MACVNHLVSEFAYEIFSFIFLFIFLCCLVKDYDSMDLAAQIKNISQGTHIGQSTCIPHAIQHHQVVAESWSIVKELPVMRF